MPVHVERPLQIAALCLCVASCAADPPCFERGTCEAESGAETDAGTGASDTSTARDDAPVAAVDAPIDAVADAGADDATGDGTRRDAGGDLVADAVEHDVVDDARDAVSEDGDAGVADANTGDPDISPDDTSSLDAPDAPAFCVPDHDGIVVRDEHPIVVGAHATYSVAFDAPVDTRGTLVDGVRHWDLGPAIGEDRLALVELRDPTEEWFADAFPTATYFARLSEREELLGVFEERGDRLLLLGVVSPEPGLIRTELTYDPPVEILRFPLTEGDRWMVETWVSGVSEATFGSPVLYHEVYTYVVDGHGVVSTPFGDFPVLRVAIDLTRTVGVILTRVRSFAFVAECFGTVATITSRDNEFDEEFDTAAEVRRLSP